MDNRSQGAALSRASHANDFFKDVHRGSLRRATGPVNVNASGQLLCVELGLPGSFRRGVGDEGDRI